MSVQRSPCGDPEVTLPTSQPGCSSGGSGEGRVAVASSERLCLPPLVLAAILSSQLRAGPWGERALSLAQAAQRYQMVSGGGLTSSSAVRNRSGKTCCRSTFALSSFPGPQKSPKEAGGVHGCLLELLRSLLPSCQAQQHPVAPLFTETKVLLCPLAGAG